MPTKIFYTHNHIPEEQTLVCQELSTTLSAARAKADTFASGTAERAAAVREVDRHERALAEASNQFFSLTLDGRAEYQRVMLTLGMARSTINDTEGIYVGPLGDYRDWSATDAQVIEALQAWRAVDMRSVDASTRGTVIECGWDDWITFLERAVYRDGFSTVAIP